jgi:hypothetical protein
VPTATNRIGVHDEVPPHYSYKQIYGTITDNINDVFVSDPGGLGVNGDGIVSGIQLLDIPSLTRLIDELNFLGEGGTILLSVPLGGLDLFNL